MTEDALRALTDSEMRLAVGYFAGKLANQRLKSLVYYLGEPKLDLAPPEVEGRSSVVSPIVRNTIQSMLPQLMVKFTGSDRAVEFEPTKPGPQEQAKAEQATEYLNYLLYVRNAGESVIRTWMLDAMLSKNGIVKVWWDTRNEESREEYVGLTDIELAQLLDDPEIEPIEQTSYPDEEDAQQRQEALEQMQAQLDQALNAAQQNPQAAQDAQALQQRMAQVSQMPPKMRFDVSCKRVRAGGSICVENVPPEEFLISRKAKSIEDAPFVAHRVARTLSELRSMGYENVDDISGDDQATALNMERIERLSWDDELAYLNTDTANSQDESQRLVWVTECYVRADYDGDGIAEMRKVVRAGNRILENEIVDCAPFVSICPMPLPHRFFGLSVADLAMESQRISTSILRGVLDNLWLSINGRYFAVDGQVNLDDLLTSRPGGVVRVKQPQAVGRLDQGVGNPDLGLGMLEYIKGFNEDSTGWTRYNQGSDGDSLNHTATGVNLVTNRADMRLDLIARNFAEGFRDLFRLMLKFVAQYQQKEDIVRLRGSWVAVNPREWRTGFDAVVSVGLGTGNKDQQVAHLMALSQQQQFGLQIGTARPENVYETQAELVRALGFKDADKFFSDPRKSPPQPQPNPAQMQAQMQMQVEQAKIQAQQQAEAAKLQMQAQLEQQKMQAQQQVDVTRQQAELEQHAAKVRAEAELERLQAELRANIERERIELERWKAKLESDTKIYIEQLKLGMQAQQAAAELQRDAMQAMKESAEPSEEADE